MKLYGVLCTLGVTSVLVGLGIAIMASHPKLTILLICIAALNAVTALITEFSSELSSFPKEWKSGFTIKR